MKISSDTKITIGIMTYNRPEFLREAVLSVLQQSLPNFELIISNDHPDIPVTFSSLSIEQDSRIRIVNQVNNLGEIRNINYLLEIAQGEWFTWLADDDLMHPDFLKLATKAIQTAHEEGVVAFFSNYIAAASPEGLFPPLLAIGDQRFYRPSEFLSDYTSRKVPLIGCYGLMHADTLRKVGGLPRLGNSFGPYSDTVIPIELIEHGSICWLDEPLIFLRTHAESQSASSVEFSAYTSAEEDFLEILERVCNCNSVKVNMHEIVANMVKWFARDELAVLSRDGSKGWFAISSIFLKHQIRVNLPRLSLKHKVRYIGFILLLMVQTLKFFIHRKLQVIFFSNSDCRKVTRQ